MSGEPIPPDKLTDLTVSIPTPPGWQTVNKPNSPHHGVDRQGRRLSNAMLIVFKLGGDFDAAELAKHGNDDARLAQNFKQLESSDADFAASRRR